MRSSLSDRSRRSEKGAFTRLDLLSLVLVVGVLGLLQLGAIGASQSRGANAVCLNNLRLLTQAWQMYAEDHRGNVPLNLGTSTSNWVNSSIDFSGLERNSDPVALTNTAFGRFAKGPEIYRCPADQSAVRRRDGRFVPRVRSYSMNGAVGNPSSFWLPTPPYRTYTNLGSIVAPPPSKLMVFLEEHPDGINDGLFAFAMPTSPASARLVDYPAAFHDLSAGLSFADGHAEMKKWVDPRTTPLPRYNNQLILNTPQPHNPDVVWMAQRISAQVE